MQKRCIFINAHIKMLYFNKENTKIKRWIE